MALLKKIDRLYSEDQLERALGLLNKALERTPGSLPLMRRRARIAAELGHRNLALADLERLLALEPTQALHWISKAELQDDYYRGLGILERGLRRLPGNPDLLIAKAQHFGSAGYFEEGIALLSQALATAPHTAALWLARAQLRHDRICGSADARGLTRPRPTSLAAEVRSALVDVETAIQLAPTPAARALRDDLKCLNGPARPPAAPSARPSGFWTRLWHRLGGDRHRHT